MHKVAWPLPVVHYALRGDIYVADKVVEHFMVRTVPDTLGASRVRELASSNAEFKCKLMGCAFMALDCCDAQSALGPVESYEDQHCSALPMCAEDNWVYVNLCTHLTCYGDEGALTHAGRVHCTTVCMPRTFSSTNTLSTIEKLRVHRSSAVDHVCRSARVVVKRKDSFHYLHSADFSILKML